MTPTYNELTPDIDINEVTRRANGFSTNGDAGEPRQRFDISPVCIGDLVEQNPRMRDPIIDGILRRGETANFIAAAKVGKSFLATGLAWSIATGDPWLGHDVAQGRVAIIDNELHPQTLASRLYRVATDQMIDVLDHRDAIDTFSLRGVNMDINAMGDRLAEIEPGKYNLVILDALYRTLPQGVSENDNAGMMQIYNKLDQYAARWDCAICVVHHSSKGEQTSKSVVDVGAGAGAIARAADTHLVIRPHEEDDLSVLEVVTRSFKSPPPRSIRFDWPLWSTVSADPVLKVQKTRGDANQEAKDREAETTVRDVLKEGNDWMASAAIRRKSGLGGPRCDRALVRMKDEIECEQQVNPRNKKDMIDVYRLAK